MKGVQIIGAVCVGSRSKGRRWASQYIMMCAPLACIITCAPAALLMHLHMVTSRYTRFVSHTPTRQVTTPPAHAFG